MRTIERVRRVHNPRLEIQGIVLTMFDKRNRLSDLVASDVRAHFGDKVYETVIPRNVRISEAPSHGRPVLIYDVALRRIARLPALGERSSCGGSARSPDEHRSETSRARTRFVGAARRRARREAAELSSAARAPRLVADRAASPQPLSAATRISITTGYRNLPHRSPRGACCSRYSSAASRVKRPAFEIIAGERRWRAAQLAQLHEIPVLVRDLNDREAQEVALIENLQRQDLSAARGGRGLSPADAGLCPYPGRPRPRASARAAATSPTCCDC